MYVPLSDSCSSVWEVRSIRDQRERLHGSAVPGPVWRLGSGGARPLFVKPKRWFQRPEGLDQEEATLVRPHPPPADTRVSRDTLKPLNKLWSLSCFWVQLTPGLPPSVSSVSVWWWRGLNQTASRIVNVTDPWSCCSSMGTTAQRTGAPGGSPAHTSHLGAPSGRTRWVCSAGSHPTKRKWIYCSRCFCLLWYEVVSAFFWPCRHRICSIMRWTVMKSGRKRNQESPYHIVKGWVSLRVDIMGRYGHFIQILLKNSRLRWTVSVSVSMQCPL